MKSNLRINKRGSVFVYLIAAAIIFVLFISAIIYSRLSKVRIEKTKSESIASANESELLTKVKICKVFPQPLTDTLKLPGTVEAYEDIDLAAKMGGTVKWVGAKEGNRITKGQKLIKLDVELLEAQIAKAKTAYELAEINYNRYKKLYDEKALAKGSLDSADSLLKTTKADLEQAKVSLAYGTLTAPSSGILDRVDVDEGEHIDLGETIMKIVDLDTVKIVFNIPEKDILFFKTGQEVDLTVSNGEDFNFKGKIEYIGMAADNSTRTYPLKIKVDNKEQHLRPGMIVKANLIRRQIQDAIAVPFFTIVEQEKGKAVFIIENGIAKEVPIKYGIFQNGMVEIVDGLKMGDQLVLVGQRNLANGEKVEISSDLTEIAKTYLATGKDLSQIVFNESDLEKIN